MSKKESLALPDDAPSADATLQKRFDSQGIHSGISYDVTDDFREV